MPSPGPALCSALVLRRCGVLVPGLLVSGSSCWSSWKLQVPFMMVRECLPTLLPLCIYLMSLYPIAKTFIAPVKCYESYFVNFIIQCLTVGSEFEILLEKDKKSLFVYTKT